MHEDLYPIPVRDLVRGEVKPEDILADEDEILDIDYNDEYTVTAEDLLCGIRKMKKDLNVAGQWIIELMYCDDEIWPQDEEDEESGRLLREESAVLCARKALDQYRYAPEEDPDCLGKSLADAETVLQAWLEIGGDPGRIGDYPDAMLRWLVADDDDDTIDRRNERRQDMFVKALDELCARGDEKAIAKRGYCYYCGTKPYPQNWEKARDAFIEIYEKNGEPWPANTLGYIFYYGRCNGGAPEYEKAFRWFSIGHAGRIHESTYKLGDLFANGYGIPKNGGIARDLYSEVYGWTLGFLLDGSQESKFADAAIRMGNCYRDGTGCDPDPEKAYGYYLQARMALEMRMRAGRHFGDESVKARLDETLEKMREVYTGRTKTLRTEEPAWLDWILDREHRACRMTWETSEDGKISLFFTRVPGSVNGSDLILATFPAADYCELVQGITVQTAKNAALTVRNDVDEIVFDDYNWYGADNRLEFVQAGEKIAELRAGKFLIRPGIRKGRRKTAGSDKFAWKKGDLEIVKIVYQGKEVKLPPQAKQPLRTAPAHKRRLKEYKTIFEFQEDYPAKEMREKFIGKLRNDEIDELVDLCDNTQGKIYYDSLKKKEKVFEFRKSSYRNPCGGGTLAVYDGPGPEKCAEYSLGRPEMNGMQTVRIGRKEIRAIQAAMEDNVLFETEYMEDPYGTVIFDGTDYDFFFAVKGCENEMTGSSIEWCRGDYDHCIHTAHVIQTLEEIRDILVPLGVPEECFTLEIK